VGVVYLYGMLPPILAGRCIVVGCHLTVNVRHFGVAAFTGSVAIESAGYKARLPVSTGGAIIFGCGRVFH
jgi:hypothetical protein